MSSALAVLNGGQGGQGSLEKKSFVYLLGNQSFVLGCTLINRLIILACKIRWLNIAILLDFYKNDPSSKKQQPNNH